MKKYILFLFFAVSCIALRAQLKVSSGTVLTLSGSVVVTVNDLDVALDGTLSSDPAAALWLSGGQETILTGSSPVLLPSLIVSKTDGAQVVLEQDLEIASGIDFVSGLLELNGYHITLAAGAELSGESAASRITGTTGGYIETTVNLNAPNAVNPGNLGAVITSTSDLGSTVVRRGHVAQTADAFSGIHRYFDISPENNAALDATLRFNYLDPELNGLDATGLVLGRSTDNVNWLNESEGTTADTDENYLQKTGIAQFSRWTAFGPGALPVDLVYFRGSVLDSGEGELTWATSYEEAFSHFEVLGSADGRRFELIGTVSDGTSASNRKVYTFTDRNTRFGSRYYRLRMVDLDGSQAFSQLIRLDYENPTAISVYPNPVTADLRFRSGESVETVEIFDVKGMLLRKLSGNSLEVVPMASYPAGMYLVRINEGSVVRVLKD